MYQNTSAPFLLVVHSDTSEAYTVFQGPGFLFLKTSGHHLCLLHMQLRATIKIHVC